VDHLFLPDDRKRSLRAGFESLMAPLLSEAAS